MTYLPFSEREHWQDAEGVQRLYAFEGTFYGASVVRFTDGPQSSYGGRGGLWELAVIEYSPNFRSQVEQLGTPMFDLVKTSVNPDGVVGWLNDEELQATLHQVAQLVR
jgi:hypothetical protein